MILFILSFIAGILTTLAPCVLPLLPVIVGSSVSSEASKKKAIVVTLSLALSVIVFTFILKVSTFFISIPPEAWSVISGVIIIFFGLISIFPRLWESLPFVNRLSIGSNKAMSEGYQRQSLWGDIIIGASLGPVFSTCSPTYFVILATVLPKSLLMGLVDLLAYVAGLSIALLIIALLGQRVVSKLVGVSDTHGIFRKSLGVVFVVLGVFVIFGVDKKIESSLLTHGLFDITRVEQALLSLNEPATRQNTSDFDSGVKKNNTIDTTDTTTTSAAIKTVFPKSHGPKAPEITHPSGFINTDGKPITIAEFKGKKIVLLDIWTYSCINCQRTLPYVVSWYKKYKDMGLEVIGLHTPEFAFEKVQKNVEDATKRFGITYPVVMDNDYATWTAYGNQYWPRKYLINEDGEIIYDHIGEGNYEETEKEIQKALSELNQKTISSPATNIPPPVVQASSPETYFGSRRNEYLGNGRAGVSGEQSFPEPLAVSSNTLYLIGQWNIQPEYAETSATVGTDTVGSDRIDYTYQAKGVYFVAGAKTAIDVEVLRDSKPIDSSVAGADIFYKNGKSFARISENRLYKIIEDTSAGKHFLEFIVSNPGLQAFTFTFG